VWGRRLHYKRATNSLANSWKRSHKILIIVPSAQVHIVDGGHFSLDTAAIEIAARVHEFMDMPKELIPGEEIMATATTPAPLSRLSHATVRCKRCASPKMLGILAILQE
jgi:hypothetical protein